ncbi:MAG: hypothetical protein ACLTXL_12565 [Clostridia bacterium]
MDVGWCFSSWKAARSEVPGGIFIAAASSVGEPAALRQFSRYHIPAGRHPPSQRVDEGPHQAV